MVCSPLTSTLSSSTSYSSTSSVTESSRALAALPKALQLLPRLPPRSTQQPPPDLQAAAWLERRGVVHHLHDQRAPRAHLGARDVEAELAGQAG